MPKYSPLSDSCVDYPAPCIHGLQVSVKEYPDDAVDQLILLLSPAQNTGRTMEGLSGAGGRNTHTKDSKGPAHKGGLLFLRPHPQEVLHCVMERSLSGDVSVGTCDSLHTTQHTHPEDCDMHTQEVLHVAAACGVTPGCRHAKRRAAEGYILHRQPRGVKTRNAVGRLLVLGLSSPLPSQQGPQSGGLLLWVHGRVLWVQTGSAALMSPWCRSVSRRSTSRKSDTTFTSTMDILLFLRLSLFGLATIAQAQSCSKPPQGANMYLTDTDILTGTFPDGGTATFACNVGYTPTGGSLTITCTAGTWSQVTLICKRKTCGSLGDVPNGNVDYSQGNEFGDTISVSCNTGYILVGKQSFICGDKGWEGGRLPFCVVVVCEPPPPLAKGSFSPELESYKYGQVLQYSCEKDYTLNGSKIRECSDNKKFKPDPPNCVKVNCIEPIVEKAEWVAQPPYGYNAMLTFQCLAGYTMIGSASITCGINSSWSPPPPSCLPKQTTTTPSDKKTPSSPITPTPSSPITPTPKGNDGNSLWMPLGVALIVIIVLTVVIAACYHFRGAFINKENKLGKPADPVGPTLLGGRRLQPQEDNKFRKLI
nr:membrane cofactor protein-like [Nerophis lumbriciformis]